MSKNKKIIIGVLIVLIIVIGIVTAYKIIENSIINRVDLFDFEEISSVTIDTLAQYESEFILWGRMLG